MWPEYFKTPEMEAKVDKVFEEATKMDYSKTSRIILNTQELINSLDGKTRNFVERVEKEQEEKYGNYDIFRATIDGLFISIEFGENWIDFYFDDSGRIVDTLGNGQGHVNEDWLRQIAEELFNKTREDI